MHIARAVRLYKDPSTDGIVLAVEITDDKYIEFDIQRETLDHIMWAGERFVKSEKDKP